MEWLPLVKSRVINLPHFLDVTIRFKDSGFDEVVVTEIREGNEYYLKHYWVHVANHIDAIVCNGRVKGTGAKKYERDILKAVELFILDGASINSVVRYPPNNSGNLYNQPAVMYDSSDNGFISFGNLDELERRLAKERNIIRIVDGDIVNVPRKDICILKLPINQKLIDDLWNWSDKTLREYIDKQFDFLL